MAAPDRARETRGMNDTTPPPGTEQGQQSRPGPRNSDRFFAWLRGLGIVRGNDRWFAGVAGGIAAKAGIDPLIVRGIFVVLALLGGPGILLYLIGWLLLPDFSGRIHVEEVIRGRASAGVIVTAVLLGVFVAIPLFINIVSGILGGAWFSQAWGFIAPPEWLRVLLAVLWFGLVIPALIIGAIIWASQGRRRYWMHAAGRPDPTEHASGTPTAAGFAQAAGAAADGATGDASEPSADTTSSGPAPFAAGAAAGAQTGPDWQQWRERQEQWRAQFDESSRRIREESKQWHDYGRQLHQQHRLGAAHVVLTLALALLGAGIASAWTLGLGVGTDMILTAGLITALSVFAVSLIIAGIRGRHTGWVGFLTFVGVVALIFAPFTHLLPEHTRFVPVGRAVESVVASDASNSAVVMLAGSAELGLSALGAESGSREIEVWQLFGSNKIELPSTQAARVEVDMLGGTIRGGGSASQQNGVFLHHTVGSHPGISSDELVTVRVRVLFGSVRVEGGVQSDGSSSTESRIGMTTTQMEAAR